MGRYGSHVEQTYRNAFGLKKSKSIDWQMWIRDSNGTLLSAPQKGINIRKMLFQNGKTVVDKVIKE